MSLCKPSRMGMSMNVCMCVSSSTKSPVDSYLCIFFMVALLEVLSESPVNMVRPYFVDSVSFCIVLLPNRYT